MGCSAEPMQVISCVEFCACVHQAERCSQDKGCKNVPLSCAHLSDRDGERYVRPTQTVKEKKLGATGSVAGPSPGHASYLGQSLARKMDLMAFSSAY
jgi:hypothetical protein